MKRGIACAALAALVLAPCAALAAEPRQQQIVLPGPDGKTTSIAGTAEELWAAAEQLVDKGQYERAKSMYQQMIENDPRDVRSHILLGRLYQFNYRKLADAVRWYKKAEFLVPASNPDGRAYVIRHTAEAYRELAEKTNSLIYFVQAIAEYEKVLDIDPDNYEVMYYLGTCRLNSKDYERASQLFKIVIEKDPDGEWAKTAKKALQFSESEARKRGKR